MQYQVIYSKRKSVAIEIDRGGKLLIRCPRGTSRITIERLLREKENWIIKHINRQRNRMPYPEDTETVKALRRRAKEELIPRAWAFADQYGFSVKSIKITSAKTRFGSCGRENTIAFSLYLMLYPPEAWDYVILHELCHTVEHNHSRRFYDLLDRYMPDHRERRKLLRQ